MTRPAEQDPADLSAAIRGVLPVIHMPYLEDRSIDFATLRREVDYLFDTDGLCLALVSDTLRLTAAERMAMPSRLVEFAEGRGPVIISVGAESSVQARAFARAAEDGGASAIMAIPPLSQGLAEPQLAEYFEELPSSSASRASASSSSPKRPPSGPASPPCAT